jgi:hypothetical protein
MINIFKALMATAIALPAVCFGVPEVAISLSFYKPSVTIPYDYKGKDIKREGLSTMFNVEGISEDLGAGFFIGGGTLGNDIGEMILGADVKKYFWVWKNHFAIPFSFGFAWRMQYVDFENNLIAMFIDEPKFSQEPEEYLSKTRDITRHNFDLIPAIDLQFFITDNFSLYAGYMYRISVSGDWEFTYKAPGKDYKDKNGNERGGDNYILPKELDPLKNSKEQIFGVPGTLRFGVKIHTAGDSQ